LQSTTDGRTDGRTDRRTGDSICARYGPCRLRVNDDDDYSIYAVMRKN